MNRLNIEDRARILSCLVEGNSMRATTRMIGVSINTVTKLLVDVGTACATYQHQTLRNLLRIPRDFDHRFHGKTITDSSAFRSLIPRQIDR